MPLPSALSKTRLLQREYVPSFARFTSPFRAEFNQDFYFGLLAALMVHSGKWFAITILAVFTAACAELPLPGTAPPADEVIGPLGGIALAGFLIRRHADEVKVTSRDGHAGVHLHFEH
jgi:hypothetical protein